MASTAQQQPVTLSPRGQALKTAIELLERRRNRHAENALNYALMSAVEADDAAVTEVSAEQIAYHDDRAEGLAALMGEMRAMLAEEVR